jgi:hypothetical protein
MTQLEQIINSIKAELEKEGYRVITELPFLTPKPVAIIEPIPRNLWQRFLKWIKE